MKNANANFPRDSSEKNKVESAKRAMKGKFLVSFSVSKAHIYHKFLV